MRSQELNFCKCVLIFGCSIFIAAAGRAQEKPDSASSEQSVSKPKFPAAKKHSPPSASAQEPDDLDRSEGAEADKDSSEQLRKRDEWFYKQRSSVNGHIPGGARVRAFQHMQRMMAAEGKLVLRPDNSYAAAPPQLAVSPDAAVTTSWTSIGPTPTTGGFFSPVTGRVTTIAVDPSDATGNTVLLGGAQGGIWRSTDAGATWKAVGDQNASLSMGSIAFAPSQPATVYAGTGESAAIGFDIYYGAGVLRSSDHGLTWTQTCTVASATCPFIGPYNDITPFGFFTLGGTRISYVAVNPSNPQMVLVGAQTQFSQGLTEGVYCSDNGGTTWSHVLADQMSTFVGFASSSVAYAAFGNPFGSSPSAPNGNGIYKATSVGSACSTIHFNPLTGTGLPLQSSMGRIDLGIAPNDSAGNTVYASISDASNGSATNLGVFVTTNGGTSWTQTSAPDICKFQCWYDNVIKVDPNNKNIVFFGGSSASDSTGNPQWVIRTLDAGSTWSSVIPSAQGPGLPHVDNHALAFVKLSTGKLRLYLGNDGGIWRTDDAEASGVSWTNLNDSTLTLTQFYPSISINASSPAIAFGGTQDNGSQSYSGTPNWKDIGVCGDGTGTAMDNLIPSSVYVACNGIHIFSSYHNGAVGTFAAAVNGINFSDNYNFVPPLASDPSNANTLYLGTTKVYQSVDAANTWTPVSYDLVSGSNFDSLTALAVSPANTTTNSSVVYAGANTGQVFIALTATLNGNATFVGVSGQGSLPPRAVSAIAVDSTDPSGNTAYVTFSGFSFVNSSFGVNDPTGHIFKTTDGGNTWKDVSCSAAVCTTPAASDLPNIPVNDVVIDPDLPGIIYTATDLGVFIGNCSATPCSWSTLATGLPHVAVLSLRLHEASRTLRAATHGRGIWDINLNNFSFSGPHISSLTPTSANTNGAPLTLTVAGSGLTGGAIKFGTTALTPTGTQTDTSISGTVSTSLLVAGTALITVKTASVTSNALPFAVTALTPTLTSLSPATTPVQPTPSTNIPITVTGQNFSSGAKVLFNGLQNGVTTKFNSSTSLTATLPAALLGPYGSTNDISVLNTPPGGGKSQALTFKVVAPAPPNDNFATAINIISFTFNDVQDSSGATTESTDPTPPCANQFTSAQGNTGGHPNGVYNTFWYKFTPLLSASLSLDTIQSYYDTVLSIWTGSAGSLTSFACNDDFNPGVTGTSQLLSVPLTAGTTYYIMVSSFGPPDSDPVALGGGTFFHFSFNNGEYPAPTLSSISPTSANSGDPDLTLTITGSGFFNGAGVQFVNSATSYGNLLATTFFSSTQLTAILPASAIALPGRFMISVVNPNPSIAPSNALPFTVNLGTYPIPGLIFMYPATMVAGSLPFTISVNGTNFVSTAVLNFNGIAKATTVNSTQNAYATISTADISTPGTVPVIVSNPPPGGGPSAPLSFVITAPTIIPTITSVSPNSLPAGYSTALTITGTGFIPGAAVELVGGGNGYWPATVISATQLSISNFGANSTGTFPLYILDPSPAGTSAPLNYSFTQPPAPTITSLSPSTAPSGSTPNLTITGTGFEPGASVLFNGSNYSTGYTSSTQLTTVLYLGGLAAGTYPLSVVDPIAAGASAPFNFIVSGPPDFSITSSGTTTQTVPAGQAATFSNVIAIAPQNGFSAQVNLSCSLPLTATYTTCSLNPASFPSGSGTASVMVTTKARSFAPPLLPRMRFIFRPQYLLLVLLAIFLSVFLLRLGRTRRQRWVGALPLAALVLFLLLQTVGCGSGGFTAPPPPLPTGTPAGTYTVTVTATSDSLTHTTAVTLVVQ